jgi:hypothetical protein
LPTEEDSAAFLDRMSSQTQVGENDAFRGILLLMDGEDTCKTFRDRVETLRRRGVIPTDWTVGEQPVTRGRLAYMLYQAMDFPGGVILTLAGPTQRYCHRELVYRKMMSQGALFAPVTGLEFLSAIRRADIYNRTGQVPGPAGDVASVN